MGLRSAEQGLHEERTMKPCARPWLQEREVAAVPERVPVRVPMKEQYRQAKLRRILVNGVECAGGEEVHVCAVTSK